MSSASISVDEFQALEQKVLLTVELIKKEREARAAAETELAAAHAELQSARAETSVAQQELAALKQELSTTNDAQAEIASLHREREAVRIRVEKMLATIDELL